MALGHLGVGVSISDIETDLGPQANACRRFYDTVIQMAMRAYEWPFCVKFQDLGLIESTPTTEWDYSYAYPSECLDFLRILSGARNDTVESQIKYKIATIDGDKVILTDEPDAVCEMIFYNESIEQWPPDFVLGASFLLAHFIAPIVSAGDPFKLGQSAYQKYQWIINDAKASALNEEHRDPAPESEFTTGRE
jgi:hypothetical protein